MCTIRLAYLNAIAIAKEFDINAFYFLENCLPAIQYQSHPGREKFAG